MYLPMPSLEQTGEDLKRLAADVGAIAGVNELDPLAPPQRCIEAIDLVKEFHTDVGVHRVLNGISFRVNKGDRMAILGRNGAGKSTLIQILSGLQLPTSGRIERGLRMSWPLALSGGFAGELTGYDNVRFVARLYNARFKDVYEYVKDFTELGEQLHVPMRVYSGGMRARLAFALSLAIDFECYLIDEVLLVGDQKFQEKCRFELFEARQRRTMIIATHDMDVVKQLCSTALVLKGGRGKVFTDLELASNIYATL
jgi:capsular polysaccharide transport system ATP-binding protein